MPLQILRQDIAKIECDAVVNATNENLSPAGNGVDASIHTAAGPELLKECLAKGHVDIGKVMVTEAYNLPCKKIFHTAGPVWQGGTHHEKELLLL